MTSLPTAHSSTGLSPEWDRWFDEAFTDLITQDEELTRQEFDALIGASWQPSSPPPSAPALGNRVTNRGHLALKYAASGWWTMIASVDCSGSSWNSSDSATPIRPASSSLTTWARSSRSGQAG